MYHILLPVDDSEERTDSQVEFVTDLPTANHDGVKVTVVHAFHGEERDAPREMQRPERVRTVRRAMEALEDAGFTVSARDAGSPPAEGILAVASDSDADLIVLGGRRRSPAGKALFGSVTQSVILDGEVPVVVAGDRRT